MSCGVPCVTTDMGDAAYILGDYGYVVPAARSDLLADYMALLLSLSYSQRQQMGLLARQRVTDFFNLPDVVKQYEALYSGMIKKD
jgi:glycosyltransferase involved in cell wall biosynthesis